MTEPTELEVAIAHKGFVWAEIEVTGRAAHGSRPHLGVDAILKPGGVSYWADSAFIAASGIPTGPVGPVGAGAHADEEWVSIDSTETLTRALIEIATRFSGSPAAPRT